MALKKVIRLAVSTIGSEPHREMAPPRHKSAATFASLVQVHYLRELLFRLQQPFALHQEPGAADEELSISHSEIAVFESADAPSCSALHASPIERLASFHLAVEHQRVRLRDRKASSRALDLARLLPKRLTPRHGFPSRTTGRTLLPSASSEISPSNRDDKRLAWPQKRE